MNKKSKKARVSLYAHRIIQIIFFFMLPALFIQIFLSFKEIILFVFHKQGNINTIMPSILLLSVVTALTAIVGRFFCGWLCAFGSFEDFLYRIPRISKKNSKRYLKGADKYLKWIKYIIFIVIVIFVWGLQLLTIPAGVNPWDLFGALSSDLSSVNLLTKGWLSAGIILLAIIIASIFVERFFCRYLCPLGAYFSVISRLRIFNVVKKRDKCKGCNYCTQKCSMGIDLSKADKVKSGECINCMECAEHCPKGNAHFELNDKSTNVLVTGAVSCGLIAGAYYLGNFYVSNPSDKTDNNNSPSTSDGVIAGIASNIPNGTYSGTGQGFRGETEVSVEVNNGIIKNISVVSTRDDRQYINKASSVIISEIISNQSTDVDTVSGATFSSNGIISAVKAALSEGDNTYNSINEDYSSSEILDKEESKGEESSNDIVSSESDEVVLNDGTYEGEGSGFRGNTQVSVKVEDGEISDIEIISYEDDRRFFERASSVIIQEIIENQTVDVDAVSGATYSSNGIKEAVANALGLEFTPSSINERGRGHNRF